MEFTRRDLGKFALASVPLGGAFGAKMIDSKFGGVQIGAITYSFNRIASPDPEAIIRAYVEIGLGEAELMSNHCEALAGAPQMPAVRPRWRPGRAPPTPEQQAERQAAQEKLAQWRASTNAQTWKAVTKKFNDAGVDVALLCYNMQDSMKDEDIEYGFSMAKGLGVEGHHHQHHPHHGQAHRARLRTSTSCWSAITATTPPTTPTRPPLSRATTRLMAYGKYNGINLDIGHFTAAGYDAVAFIKQHHDKITNLHLKDRKKNHGPNVAVWGTGDTPMKEVLQLLKKEKYPFPANLELEYPIPQGSNIVAEAKKCFAYVKSCLA